MKKVTIVRDKAGKMIASYEKRASGSALATVELEKGHFLEEIEAPSDYARDPAAFYKLRAEKPQR
jgi:hypothetical protein